MAPEPQPERPLINGTAFDGEIGAPLDPRCTFENFVVGQPNELAFAAAKRIADLPAAPSTRCSCTAASGSARRT